MKLLSVLVVVTLAGGATAQDAPPVTSPRPQCAPEVSAECPAVDPGTPVYLADPEDCSAFCECSNGVAYSKQCTQGTYYDPDRHICDWPTNVDCGDRPVPAL